MSLRSPALAGRFFTPAPPGKLNDSLLNRKSSPEFYSKMYGMNVSLTDDETRGTTTFIDNENFLGLLHIVGEFCEHLSCVRHCEGHKDKSTVQRLGFVFAFTKEESLFSCLINV